MNYSLPSPKILLISALGLFILAFVLLYAGFNRLAPLFFLLSILSGILATIALTANDVQAALEQQASDQTIDPVVESE